MDPLKQIAPVNPRGLRCGTQLHRLLLIQSHALRSGTQWTLRCSSRRTRRALGFTGVAAVCVLACAGCQTLVPLAELPPRTQTAPDYRPERYPTVSVSVRGASDRSGVTDAFVRALIDRGHRVVEPQRGGSVPSAELRVEVETERVERAPGSSVLDDIRDAVSGDRRPQARYVEQAVVSARLIDTRTGQVLWLGRLEGAVPEESRRQGVAAPAVARRLAEALPRRSRSRSPVRQR